jgi:predicted ATPase
VVDPLNLGARFATTRSEALELARLNAEAGGQAKATAAYRAALEYFGRAVELLGDEGWQTDYARTLELHQQAAQAACLCGQYDRLEALGARIRERAKTPLDLAPLDETEIKARTARGLLIPAIRHGLAALERFGVRLSEEPAEGESRNHLERTLGMLRRVGLEGILGLPEMTSAEQRACTAILSAIGEPAYAAAPGLFIAWASLMAELSLSNGSCSLSPFADAAFALALCATEEHVETGYQLAKVALRLLEQRRSEPLKCRLLNIFGCTIQPWKEHIRRCIPSPARLPWRRSPSTAATRSRPGWFAT